MSTIEALWRELERTGRVPVQTRVSADHPLDLFAQVDAKGRVGLLAISEARPERLPTYSAVTLAAGERADGRWATSLSLSQPSLFPLFASMCDQIVEAGCSASRDKCASSFMLGEVARWHRLLSLGADGLLSPEEQVGLFGELEILRQAAIRFGAEPASLGWLGPDDAPQDFVLPCGLVEVKAVAATPTVTISSLEQLDADSMALVVVDVVRAATGTGGHSLVAAVELTRHQLSTVPGALEHFENQLRKIKYVDRDEYAQIEFRVPRIRWFAVNAEFPRLVRTCTASAVSDARYRLALRELASFETDPFPSHGQP